MLQRVGKKILPVRALRSSKQSNFFRTVLIITLKVVAVIFSSGLHFISPN